MNLLFFAAISMEMTPKEKASERTETTIKNPTLHRHSLPEGELRKQRYLPAAPHCLQKLNHNIPPNTSKPSHNIKPQSQNHHTSRPKNPPRRRQTPNPQDPNNPTPTPNNSKQDWLPREDGAKPSSTPKHRLPSKQPKKTPNSKENHQLSKGRHPPNWKP